MTTHASSYPALRLRPSGRAAAAFASFVVLALCLALPAGAGEPPSDSELAAYADRVLAEAYPAAEPGAAVLIRRGGEVVLRKGYGLAELELGVPASPDHVFEIGSVTKQFTAAAILKLEEKGLLATSDPLGRFLPDFPTGDATVTLDQLLTHTSGVPSYTDMAEWLPRWREDMSLPTLIGIFRGKPLDFAPGTDWTYSNSGYVLLGAVIENVAGTSYEEFVEKELFAPLGMTRSRYGHKEELVPGRAAGYSPGGDGWVNAPYLSMTQPYAAGSLMSTVDDLARWAEALAGGEVLGAASLAKMNAPAILAGGPKAGRSTRYGFGQGVGVLAGHPIREHGGGIHGYVSDLLHVPDAGLTIAILSNRPQRPGPGAYARRIAATALGEPLEARVRPTVAEADLAAYPGVYGAGDERRTVTREGGRLFQQRSGGSKFELLPAGRDRFELPDGDASFEFVRDAGGQIAAVEVDANYGPITRAERTDEPLPAERQAAAVDLAAFAPWIGVYELAPGFDLAITREGDRLYGQATGQPRFELFPMSPTRVFLKEVDAEIEFVPAGEAPPGVVLHQGGATIPGRRK